MQDFLPDPVSIPYHNLTPIWLECVQPVGTCSEVPKLLDNWYQYVHPQAIGLKKLKLLENISLDITFGFTGFCNRLQPIWTVNCKVRPEVAQDYLEFHSFWKHY